MKHFLFKIEDDVIKEGGGEVQNVPADFIECQNSFGPQKIYYKIEDTKVTEVIGEAFSEEVARRRVGDFLSSLNINIF
jgi:hypothetical protein